MSERDQCCDLIGADTVSRLEAMFPNINIPGLLALIQKAIAIFQVLIPILVPVNPPAPTTEHTAGKTKCEMEWGIPAIGTISSFFSNVDWGALVNLIAKEGTDIYTFIQELMAVLNPPAPTPAP